MHLTNHNHYIFALALSFPSWYVIPYRHYRKHLSTVVILCTWDVALVYGPEYLQAVLLFFHSPFALAREELVGLKCEGGSHAVIAGCRLQGTRCIAGCALLQRVEPCGAVGVQGALCEH